MPYSQIIHATCKHCGQPFSYRWRKEGREFCGQTCYHAARAEANPPRPCAHCGKPFHVSPSAAARGVGRYCSEECQHAARRVPVAERFWTKVDKNGPIPEHRPELGPCWVWTAYRNAQGYGTLGIGDGRKSSAHRVSYEMAYGPIPDGMDVCHHCDNPSCVRPDHLFTGTERDNLRDAQIKDRRGLKLTINDVLTLRARAADGMPVSQLAREYGVDVRNVRAVIHRETWKHV